MILDYFSLAFQNLRHRGVRSWLTVLGIFIGIAAVVSLIAMGQGLQQAITGQFNTLSADKLIIQSAEAGFGPPGSTAAKRLNEHDLRIIESVPEVDTVVTRLIRVAKVEYNKASSFEYLASIPQDSQKALFLYDTLNLKISSGKLITPTDKGKIVIGKNIAESKSFGKEIRVGTHLNIQGKDFEVAGILKPAQSFQINSVILMLEDDMKDTLKIGDEIDLVVVQVKDKNKIKDVADEITNRLRRDRKEKEGEEDFSVQTPVQALSTVNTVLNIVNLIVGGIAAISLLVGGIGIANTMYTSVLERTKEIGTMKAVGAQNKDILSIFLIESGMLGLIGGIIGAALGVGLAYLASFAANTSFGTELFQVSIRPILIGSAVLFSFTVGILSGILPAVQASRLKPVEALRK
ncbi:ABC transporter permease [Candidatus Pacearchaeota archaeon]|nr:ABC transporter permease [Candidatus Pacearchaeota archaeon]